MCPECKAAALVLRRRGLTLDECLDSLREHWQVSRATLHRFLQAHGLGSLRKSKEKEPHGKFSEYDPGFLHIDVTQTPALEGWERYVFVAVDRATRMSFIKVFERQTARNAVKFLKHAVRFFPFAIHRILTDNGAEFTNKTFARWGVKCKKGRFERFCVKLGIKHKTTRPYTPKTNGLVERYNGLLKEATLGKRTYHSHAALEADMLSWTELYNRHRRHGSIGRKTPLQEASRRYTLKPDLFSRDPALLMS